MSSAQLKKIHIYSYTYRISSYTFLPWIYSFLLLWWGNYLSSHFIREKLMRKLEGVTKKSRLTFSSLAAPEATVAHPWYKNKSVIMKFPLKWGIVHVCRLINTGNIEQNVFFVKTQFLRFCNFFYKKIIKSKLVNFAKMANS